MKHVFVNVAKVTVVGVKLHIQINSHFSVEWNDRNNTFKRLNCTILMFSQHLKGAHLLVDGT